MGIELVKIEVRIRDEDSSDEPQPDPEVMKQAMEDYRAGRYQSAREILEELKAKEDRSAGKPSEGGPDGQDHI